MVKNRLITDIIIIKTLLSTLLGSHALINNSYLFLVLSIILAPLGRLFLEININSKFNFEALSILVAILIISAIYCYKKFKIPSNQMKIRTSLKCLMQTIIISVLCLIGIHNNVSATIITIAISTVLLIPLINIGLNLGIYFKNSDNYNSYKYQIIINSITLIINLGILLFGTFLKK